MNVAGALAAMPTDKEGGAVNADAVMTLARSMVGFAVTAADNASLGMAIKSPNKALTALSPNPCALAKAAELFPWGRGDVVVIAAN